MRLSLSHCLGLVVALPLGTGAFLSGGPSRPERLPRVGERVDYDGGDAEGAWLVTRRIRSASGVVLELSNGDDTAFADPCQVRPAEFRITF